MGDVFVSVTGGGGLVFLDGATTGIVAPGVIRGVTPGTHTIRVDEGCKTGTTDVTVRLDLPAAQKVTVLPYQIVRSTLELAPKPVKAAKGPHAPVDWRRVGLDAAVTTEAPPGAAPAPTATPAPGRPGPRMAPIRAAYGCATATPPGVRATPTASATSSPCEHIMVVTNELCSHHPSRAAPARAAP